MGISPDIIQSWGVYLHFSCYFYLVSAFLIILKIKFIFDLFFIQFTKSHSKIIIYKLNSFKIKVIIWILPLLLVASEIWGDEFSFCHTLLSLKFLHSLVSIIQDDFYRASYIAKMWERWKTYWNSELIKSLKDLN